MKAVKDQHHGLLLNYFGLGSKYYLAVTVLSFFDFGDPDQPLKEQDMWPFIQGELGSETIFDQAMPKPRGEVLLRARCFAPGGRPVPACTAAFRAGPISKRLAVFGPRYWRGRGLGLQGISDPQPFTFMDITYQHAFGGPDFPKNPLGLGLAPVVIDTGDRIVPLPTVENPDRLIGAPEARPDPAGFGPYDFMWPQRSRKLGTYDNKWFQEKWPFYPDDMDWSYFNAAPDDQQMEAYFQGGEPLAFENLHPEKQLVQSRLPRLRQRMFVNQLLDLKKPKGETRFQEVRNNLETVWLFPHAEKGVAVYRGITEMADDEPRDVVHLFLATEGLDQPAQTIDHYWEVLQKRLDRTVKVDLAPLVEARRELDDQLKGIKDIPKAFQEAVDRSLGKAPLLKRTPQEMEAMALRQIEMGFKQLDMAETQFLDLKAKFGHVVKVDLAPLARARQKLEAGKERIKKFSVIHDKVKTAVSEGQAKMKEGLSLIDSEVLAQGGLDLEAMFKPEKQDPWQTSGFEFVSQCRKNLELDRENLMALRNLGLRQYAIKKHWLGINPAPAVFDAVAWGLKPALDTEGQPRPLVIPAGLVIPHFEGLKLDRIAIRPGEFADGAKEVLVPGSKDEPLTLGAEPGKAFVRVADTLEAMLLFQDAGDFVAVTALSDPGRQPAGEAADLLGQAPQFLVALPGVEGRVDPKELAAWVEVHPKAEPLAIGDGPHLAASRRAGHDLERWVAAALRPGLGPVIPELPADHDPLTAPPDIPQIDVKAQIETAQAKLKAHMQPTLDEAAAKQKELEAKVRETLISQGHNPDELLKPPPKREGNPFALAIPQFVKTIEQERARIKKSDFVQPEHLAKLDETEKQLVSQFEGSASRYEAGMAKLEATKAKAAAGLPDWAKKLFAQSGVDIDDREKMTREVVVYRHQNGLNLAGKNLSGLDLSGLDLSGVDLQRSNLQKTIFKDCILDGGNFSRAIGEEADFTGASLKEAIMVRGLFGKAKFVKADLSSVDLSKSLLKGADLTEANLTRACLEKTLLEEAKLVKARVREARAGKGYFLQADLSGADFTGADLTKAVFLKAKLDDANLSGGVLKSALFITANGKKVNFSGSDMFNSRFFQETVLPEADFTGIKADRSCWMNADLSGGDFRGSVIGQSLIEDSDLTGANFKGVKARQTRFNKSNLSGADLSGINLFQGSLRKARLPEADLTDANLYSVEFYRTGVGHTKLDGANLKMTKLFKRTDLLPKK
jgi:uncharacterized protein YjbI with pentapeptide repeats